jgi:hypothetical protein
MNLYLLPRFSGANGAVFRNALVHAENVQEAADILNEELSKRRLRESVFPDEFQQLRYLQPIDGTKAGLYALSTH